MPRSSVSSPHADRAARVVVVVGGSSGIGLATAARLRAQGDRVVLVARHEGRLREAAASLPVAPDGSGPDGVSVAVADVTDAGAVEAALAHAEATFGRVDAVVSTAQAMAYGTLEQVPADVVRHLGAVAVGGVLHVAQAALPRFRAQGHGSLVVVSSLLAQVGVPSMGAYCTAKWGQLGLVRTLQSEVQRVRGVHVSLVLPGAIDTPIYRQAGTWAGREGSAPPPVLPADAVARAITGCLDRPRRMVHVGPLNRLAVLGYRTAPAIFDRVAPLLVDAAVLRGPTSADEPGNVFEPRPATEGESGGWDLTGRLRGPRGRRRWRGV